MNNKVFKAGVVGLLAVFLGVSVAFGEYFTILGNNGTARVYKQKYKQSDDLIAVALFNAEATNQKYIKMAGDAYCESVVGTYYRHYLASRDAVEKYSWLMKIVDFFKMLEKTNKQ